MKRTIANTFEPTDIELLTSEFSGLSETTHVDIDIASMLPTSITGDDGTDYALKFYEYWNRFVYWRRVWLAYVPELDTLVLAK